jgi:CcmD family protein
VRNYAYLFWGYTVVWLGIAAYLFSMFARLRRVGRRVEALEAEVRRLTDAQRRGGS